MLCVRMKPLLCLLLWTVALCAPAGLAAGCGSDSAPASPTSTFRPAAAERTPTPSVPTATPERHIFPNPAWNVPPAIEEQIFASDVIVRASLLSVTAATETVSGGEGVAATYRPVQELRFTAHEYLKGSGPAQTVVVVRGEHTYKTLAEAQQAATASVSWRNTSWDGRQAVLFLNPSYPSYSSSGGASGASGQAATPALEFNTSNPEVQSEWSYSIDTLSRAWLPASDAGGASGQAGTSGTVTFITDGSQSPHPTISLADLRSKITEFETMLSSGAGSPGFRNCIQHKIELERHRRAVPWSPFVEEAELPSGSSSGTEVIRYNNSYRDAEYNRFWLSGPDMSLFQALTVDSDSLASNGYDHALTTARPLPAGEYRVFYNTQGYEFFPCNFVPQDVYRDWTVTVNAPAGTLHEAFFDPATEGSVVGFSVSAGILEPAGFSVGGASTTVVSLLWQDGSVALTLAPDVSLGGQALDFIALDGSVALTLEVSAATADSAAGSLTWALAQQPWRDGDQLMLRIRQSVTPVPTTPTPAAPEPTATPEPATATPEPATATPAPEPATPTPEPAATATPEPVDTPTPVPLDAPPVPSGLAASASGADSVALSWTALAGASHYGVYRYFPATSELPAFWGKVSENVAEASYTVTGLDCETEYHYGIAAHGDGVTYSASWGPGFSDPVAVTTGACPGPGT